MLRINMTEKLFIHKKAFANVKTNFIFHDYFTLINYKLLDKKLVINLKGKKQSIFNFTYQTNKKSMVPNSTLNLKKKNLIFKHVK